MASRASDIDQPAHPYSIINTLEAGSALCLTLATLTTAIRLYTKFFIIKSHGWEDCEQLGHRLLRMWTDRIADTMSAAWVFDKGPEQPFHH